MSNTITCPTDNVKVSETRTRLTAAWVFLSGLAFLFTGTPWIGFFLALDFFIRAFGPAAYSPFNLLSGFIEKKLSLKTKPVDRAPKLFAAQMGFVFSDCLLIAGILELKTAAYSLAGLLVLFSFLESAFAFCAGCHVYSLLKRFSPSIWSATFHTI